MKILWLNAGLLLPLDKGGKLRTWHLMRHLARKHEITYFSFTDPAEPEDHLRGMREVCDRLETVPRTETRKGSIRFYVDAAKYLLNRRPYAIAKYRSAEYARRVEALLSTSEFDLLVCDFLVPVVNLPERLPCRSVLFTHNVESEIWRRHAATAKSGLRRWLLQTQWRRMLRTEGAALSLFDMVLAVSAADASTLARLYGSRIRGPIHVVPTGVDTKFFRPDGFGHETARHLVFTGSMDWLPNEDGVLYFCSEVLPLIRQAEPAVTLSIVGRAPTPAVRRLARPGVIEVSGRVDDVRPHIARAGIYVVPLRIGGGTRLKIFEAMAMGRAVVSTTVGAEGLPVSPGRDIVIADQPRQFADAVVALIRDADARRALQAAARQLVVQSYDWSVVARDFEDALVTIAPVDCVARAPVREIAR
jgi:sugar transferase (PEP-CTERM/EpsH1 system associated)